MLILSHLWQKSWIEQRTGHWFASTRVMDLGERGQIHSNIPDTKAFRVVDVDSGKEIGTIAGVFDDVFVLARQTWKVISVRSDFIRVRRFKGSASSPFFRRHRERGAFYYLLPTELKDED